MEFSKWETLQISGGAILPLVKKELRHCTFGMRESSIKGVHEHLDPILGHIPRQPHSPLPPRPRQLLNQGLMQAFQLSTIEQHFANNITESRPTFDQPLFQLQPFPIEPTLISDTRASMRTNILHESS